MYLPLNLTLVGSHPNSPKLIQSLCTTQYTLPTLPTLDARARRPSVSPPLHQHHPRRVHRHRIISKPQPQASLSSPAVPSALYFRLTARRPGSTLEARRCPLGAPSYSSFVSSRRVALCHQTHANAARILLHPAASDPRRRAAVETAYAPNLDLDHDHASTPHPLHPPRHLANSHHSA